MVERERELRGGKGGAGNDRKYKTAAKMLCGDLVFLSEDFFKKFNSLRTTL